ncbi:transient receptor potential cation channel subfamily M member 7 [Sinocyclocheilus anshuiensis]|uniref:transient receptor potential cation channel subfamily M member 7 n=1 Tax=Sinocyclocheilus anshuiensis TaxID=1608454 RepID=UPI0007B89EE3|nr:PREDICTED: transient receptor potential cation channel subfamily M member 7-like [Sinocyclocheilus anshuiensis]
MSQKSWIEHSFTKRECVYILPVSKDPHRCLPGCQICQQLVRCCCGRLVRQHVGFTATLAVKYSDVRLTEGELSDLEQWSVEKHTEESPTDAYGVINFQGGSHSYRAKTGGTRLSTCCRYTLFIGRDVVAPYQTLLNPLSKLNVLNNFHSHFVLVDDGTVGKYGAEVKLRRELEKHINLQRIHARIGQGVPVVALIFEGGPNVILTVLEYLQESPPVPVVVCEGTGRAADILAYVHKQTEQDGALPDGVEADIIATIKKTFNFSQSDALHLFQTLMECMKNKELITVFPVGSEDHQDIDVAILKALLKGTNASAFDQLVLTLAWDRVDIAKDHVFVYGQQLLVGSLEQAMLDALVMDRVEFVKLLIENGVSMHRFLTITRLEELYNTKQTPTNPTLYHLVRDVKQGNLPPNYKITLIDMGLVIEYLMGGTYRCNYTRKRFRIIYNNLHGNSRRSGRHTAGSSHESFSIQADKKEKTRHNHFINTAQPYKPRLDSVSEQQKKKSKEEVVDIDDPETRRFPYPFNELLVWAVLMKRQKMSLFFWQHGEESMAKALVACKLLRSMGYEAKKSDVVDDTSEELKEYSNEFGTLAVDLLEQSFRQDETMAMKLLTYELKNWSNSTCLKLAVSSRLRPFVAHTCTQMLLSDMWMGRLNMRKNSWYKVILSILVPPAILLLEYKTKAEMSHIPQSQDAHQSMEDSEHNLQKPDDIPMDVFKEARPNENADVKNEMEVHVRSRRLPITRKFYAFYHAPIVKFWFNTLFYIGFLMLYSYVVLVRMEPFPSPQEWVVILYIFTLAVEKIREMFMSEGGKISQKIKVWFSDYFNVSDFLALLMFFVGFGLRFGSGSVFIAGRIVYCLNIIFWYVRLLDILAVNQQAGPYVMMIGKMVANMFYIVVIMAVVLLSFGVPRKAILYPNEDPSWTLAKDVVFQPYWMMYGEVYAYEIDVCANSSEDHAKELCATGVWLTPLLQAVYLFVQYILMVNLLIAFFNNVYMQVMSISNLVWKYQRYHFIMAYHDKPVLPPPLILLSHAASVLSSICRKRKKDSSAYGLKLFLTEEDQKKLHDFEEQCVETYFHEKDDQFHSGSEERIRLTSDRVETMCVQLKEVGNKVNFIKRSLHTLDSQIGHLQDLSALTVDTLKALTAQRASEASKVHNQITRELSVSKNLGPDVTGHSKSSALVRCSVGFLPPAASIAESLFGGGAGGGAEERQGAALPRSPEAGSRSDPAPATCFSELFLTEEDQKKLHDFEEQCVETYFHEKDDQFHSGSEERIRLTSDRVETMCVQLKEVGNKVNFIKRSLHTLDSQIGHLQDLSALTVDTLKALTAQRASEASKVHNQITRELSVSKNLGPDVTGHSKSSALVRCSVGFLPPAASIAESLFGGGAGGGAEERQGAALPRSPEAGSRSDPAPATFFVSTPSQLTDSRTHTEPAHAAEEFGAFAGEYEEEEEGVYERSDGGPPVVVVSDPEREGYVNHAFADDEDDPPERNTPLPLAAELGPRGPPCFRRDGCCRRALNRLRQRSGGHKDDPEGQRSFPEEVAVSSQQSSPSRKAQDAAAAAQGHMRTVNSYAGFTEFDRNPSFLHPESTLGKQERTRVSLEDVSRYEDLLLGKSAQSSRLSGRRDAAGLYAGRHTHLGVRKDSIGSPFKPMESYQYSAVERNNLMRLSQSIPFTPVPPRGKTQHCPPVSLCPIRLCCLSCSSGRRDGSDWFLHVREETWSDIKIHQTNTPLKRCLCLCCEQEIQQQRAAQKLTFAFNQIRPKTIPYSPRFLEVFLLYCHSAGQWFAIEECITGDFRKFNNNNGDEIVPTNLLEETMLAFSHWTYEYTRGELLVLDLQGVGEILTDPSVIKSGEKGSYDMIFGPANLGDDAIRNFRTKHHCNSCCRKLKLPDLKRNDYTPDKLTSSEGPSHSPPAGGAAKEQRPSMRLML